MTTALARSGSTNEDDVVHYWPGAGGEGGGGVGGGGEGGGGDGGGGLTLALAAPLLVRRVQCLVRCAQLLPLWLTGGWSSLGSRRPSGSASGAPLATRRLIQAPGVAQPVPSTVSRALSRAQKKLATSRLVSRALSRARVASGGEKPWLSGGVSHTPRGACDATDPAASGRATKVCVCIGPAVLHP